MNDSESFRDNDEFIHYRDFYLRHAVDELDYELVKKMLELGANPNIYEPWGDDLLHSLMFGYEQSRTVHGSLILKIAELLLKYGADPNHVGQNNWRTIDGCIYRGYTELVDLLVKFGADSKQREFQ